MTRSGRRPGSPETRAHIVAVARRAFGARGYEATSLRSIAAGADVDPGLLVHYFGTKQGVFRAALDDTIRPGELFAGLEGLGRRETADRIVGRYLSMLGRPDARDVIMGLVRSAVSSDHAANMLRTLLVQEALTSLSALAGGPDAQLRASLIVSQLIGIAMLRYVVRAEHLIRATDDELIESVGAAIEQYLR
ncbi:TetR family transcriptional regulator [Acidiferrimicrobium sp. IK]|uniref:TetR/AcrR family transcriptional regulator n=1 Tax=Acidiferrimicrobium sp. IK TaxID=2871700 RepID=UPI0021CB9043|nr:TetR family transcriptional regulator [Acidiferrimicrobium sp. IK]MCU4185257.1 TetR family transcriptional regulator [Acidiferrimicrobium sp. IK]